MSHTTILQDPLDVLPEPDAWLDTHVNEARRWARIGTWVLLFGLLPALGWMTFAPLSSAVLASGVVKVDLDRRPVQHAEGGTVREVLVRDGQRVEKGQPLLVLGDVAVDADRQRVSYRVMADRASVARLEAEQLGLKAIKFPDEVLQAAQDEPQLAEQLAKERSLFDVRRSGLSEQVGLLRAQQVRLSDELRSLQGQIAEATDSLRHQTADLENNRQLVREGFVSVSRLSQQEANVADYRSKLQERQAEVARVSQRRGDVDLRIRGLENEFRQQASDQLKVSAARLTEMQQEQRKSSDAAQRQVITAPIAGEVLNLKFTSPGTVVGPREPIADIVPANPRLVVEVRVRTEDVNNIHQGQKAEIRFTAFSHRTTRLVDAKVFYVAPDRQVDRNTGVASYTALIEADAVSLAKAGDIKLQAGMPAEVYVVGEERTPLQYLIEPVTQILRKAGRER